ncbi:hydrolase [Chlamydia buteonis]|uniref:Hydrolase n=1 Tax=Chlamydia buteonis TaxID=2494525 RepID=A0ABX8LE57_9CHLA|nr:hydrolase [Chlamydia buteonis]QXE27175.1 hydrolase [Chlamydia buteonis]QXE27905.1 hydrolase [Chlamydia buteonis]
MKNIIKNIKTQYSSATTPEELNETSNNENEVVENQNVIPDEKILFSCVNDSNGTSKNVMRQPWNVSNQRITNIVRGNNDPAPNGSIALKSDLSDYLQKGDITTTGAFLRSTGGLMIGDIDMGSSYTVVGLPTSYKTTFVNSTDIASVGMVEEDIGTLAHKVTDLINRINQLTSANGLDKIIQDLGTPTLGDTGIQPDVTLKKPQEAKWLVRAGGNSMQGDLGFQKSEQGSPTTPEPTITNLLISENPKNKTTAALGAISTGTSKDDLQRIVAVGDITETLKSLTSGNNSYPNWSGMDIPFVCLKQGASNGSSSTGYDKSKNSELYIQTKDENSITLLRRGVYCVSFLYDFTQTTPPIPPPAKSVEVSCALSLQPQGGEKQECYKVTGNSNSSLIGKTYIFVPGDRASVSTDLIFEISSTPEVSQRTWTVTFIGAAY